MPMDICFQRLTPAVKTIMVLCVAVFLCRPLAIELSGLGTDWVMYYLNLTSHSEVPGHVCFCGWWQWLTHTFVNVSLVGLLIDLLVMALVGPALENEVGSRKFCLIFVVSSLMGSVPFYLSSSWYVPLGLACPLSAIICAYLFLHDDETVRLWLLVTIPINADDLMTAILIIQSLLIFYDVTLTDAPSPWVCTTASSLTGVALVYFTDIKKDLQENYKKMVRHYRKKRLTVISPDKKR